MQNTLLYIIQAICAEIGAPSPSSVLTSSDTNVLKLLALLRALCQGLTAEYDWQALQVRETFNLVADQATYSLPTGYLRLINGTMFNTSSRWAIAPATPIEWEILNVYNLVASPFQRLRVFGNELNFFPTPGSDYTIIYDYISSYYVYAASGGAPQADFLTDSDICAFNSRLVIAGVKYKYWSQLGQDTTALAAEYSRLLNLEKGHDQPASRLSLVPRSSGLVGRANIPDGNWQA